MLEALQMPANQHLNEANVLMCQYALFKAEDETGKIFDLWDLMRFKYLLMERDGFYELEIDREYFKHMMDLASEDDIEADDWNEFVAEAKMRLEIRTHLATLVLKEEKRRKDTNQAFDICDEATWRQARFIRVTQAIGEALKDPAKKQMFLNRFTKYNQKLTYYEFSKVTQAMGVDFVANWMFEDFLSDLDSMGLAFIELNDIASWLRKYGFDIGVQINEVDQSDKLKKKLAIGPKEYQVTEADYYRGIPTILNSEVAALATAIKLSDELGDGEMFFDRDFGPQSADDLDGKARSMYCNGVKPQSHPDPEQVDWLRPSEYLDGDKTASFVKGDASANEVKQGALGDCWFIGALSVLASRDELLRGLAEAVPPEMVDLIDQEMANLLSIGVYPPIFHKFREKGIYVLRFSKNHKWRYVIIDDRLPVYSGNKSLVFGRCKSDDELWVPLIEKAYAKLHGCYQTLVSGFIDDGLADMTAMVCEKRHLHDRRGMFNLLADDFWDYLEQMMQNGCLMGCSVTGGTEHAIRIDGVDTGVLSGHAYSLNDAFRLHNPEQVKRQYHRLLRIRNPWGRGEWKGKWSDMSDEIDDEKIKGMLERDYIAEMPEDEQFQIGANDGTFFINYASWRDIYNRLFVVNDFPDDWSAVYFKSQWTPQCSGGLPIEKTLEANQRFAKNPQYMFVGEKDCELFVSLAQNDGREVREGQYSKYPFKDRIVSTMLFLFELPDSLERLAEYGKPQPMEKATPKVLHEISMRVKLQAGKRYVVVPSPRSPNTSGNFTLAFYTDLSQTEYDVKRLDDPTDRYNFVTEEYEKSERTVPQWKITWCKENLTSMIGKDDMELSKSRVGGPKKAKKKKKKTSRVAKAMGEQMKQMVDKQIAAEQQDGAAEDEEEEPMY